jgi:outer membrane receptor protein involved in Fe transport
MKHLPKNKTLSFAIGLTAFMASGLSVAAEALKIEEVIVTSQFRDTSLLDLASSVSVFDESEIAARGASNIEQLLNMAPNVNLSAGASRGRFFQIRGIGERSQFIDPVSPSVGLIIDGVDFSGLGLAASTLDIEQVEVLRGPQGTEYGANGLAGLITMRSAAPTSAPLLKISAEAAQFDSYKLGFVASGPLTEKVSYRVAAQNQQSDGYIKNRFLDRDDVNNIDESILRGKIRYQAADDLQLDFALVYINADNGYDAFSLNNTRTTLSDQPGHDRQESVAGSVVANWSASPFYTLESVLSVADSSTEYGYDEDWAYVGYHPYEFSSADNYQRDKDNISADFRFISTAQSMLFNDSTSWVVGAYLRNESEDLQRNKTKDLMPNGTFNSQFDTENYAFYGQLRSSLNPDFTLVSGLRVEQRNADYSDSLAVQSNNDESLWGGNITLEYHYSSDSLIYATVSRGYKAGGVNGRIISASASNSEITADMYEFETEHMLNYELGLKGSWLDNRLQAQVAAFYQDRSDVQAKQSIFDPSNYSFDDYLSNAAKGETTGLEVEMDYLASETIRLFAAAGWLSAEFKDFSSITHVDAKDDNTGTALPPVDMDGREVAHAPHYQYFVGGELALMRNLILRIELEGKDAFYFSNSHNEKSASYELVNARLTYRASNWDISLWGRNLANDDVQTRGFYFSNAFGNDPAKNYIPETYYQLGEPRVAGISANYSF